MSWSASSDNVGVTGYRVERCQGVGCSSFVQVAAPAGTSFGDSGLAASTSYSYRVRAVDAAGNLSGYSTRCERDDAGGDRRRGLVAAYSFNEGSGSSAADASGTGERRGRHRARSGPRGSTDSRLDSTRAATGSPWPTPHRST